MTDIEFDLVIFLNGLAWRVMRVKRVCGVLAGGLATAGLVAGLVAANATAGVGASALRASVVLASGRAAAVPAVGNPAGHQPVPTAGQAVSTSHPNHVIGRGTPAGCTSAAVVKAVAEGGIITFDCGPKPVTIKMTATAKVVNTSHQVVLDGGGKVTLSGGAKIRILYMNTCDPKQVYTTGDCWEQRWPRLVVQNISFVNAYSGVKETATSDYGGGAIFDQGGQLTVVNSAFIDNRCYKSGPDLGGGAVRALGMYPRTPVYITHDTFTGNSCSNGAALSGLFANFYVVNSLLTNNKATGFGANPAGSGTAGGGSGGAIYNDGNSYNVTISGTVMTGNVAPEGGDAIFYVVDSGKGTLKIEYSTLHNDYKGKFQDAHDQGIFSEVDGRVTPPAVVHSSIN